MFKTKNLTNIYFKFNSRSRRATQQLFLVGIIQSNYATFHSSTTVDLRPHTIAGSGDGDTEPKELYA